MSWDTEIAADSPILWWKFDEVSGSVVDHSVNSNFGTVFGGVTREQAGILGAGSAYNLSLTGSVYCVMPSQLSSATAFSMECLFRRTGGDNRDTERRSFYRALKNLQDAEYIGNVEGWLWLRDK